MKERTDQELKSMLEHALDSALSPMHELERRWCTVSIDTSTLQELNRDQPDGLLRMTVFDLKVFKQTTEVL